MFKSLRSIDRRSFVQGAIALGTGAAIGGVGSAQAQSVQLRMQNYFPEGPNSTFWLVGQKLIELMSAKTEGRITGRHFPAGALVQIPDYVPATQRGTLDMFTAFDSLLFGTFPWTEWNDVPGLTDWPEEFTNLINKGGLFDHIDQLVQQRGLKMISIYSHGDVMMIATRNKPILTQDDFKGQKIRTPGPLYARAIGAVGGSAVAMPPQEVYTAVQTGVVDGVALATFGYTSLRLNEVAPQLTMLGDQVLGPGTAAWYMSLDRFNKFSKKDQEAIMESGRELATFEIELLRRQDKEFQDNAKKLGVTVHHVPIETRRKWTEIARPAVLETYLSRGGPEAKKIIEKVEAFTGRKL